MMQPNQPLAYATPGTFRPSAVPGAVVLIAGLALIVIGGCFLVGVAMDNQPTTSITGPASLSIVSPPMTPSRIIFQTIMYVMAFVCFAGSACLIALGVKWLRRIVHAV